MTDILEDLEFEELLVKLVNKIPKRSRNMELSKSYLIRRIKKVSDLPHSIAVEVFDLYVKLNVFILTLENVVETKSGSFTARYYKIDLVPVSKMATRSGVKAKVGDLVDKV